MNNPEKGVQRTCLSCRTTADKKTLIRYVLDPEGLVTVDYRQRLPGRGVYTCLSRNCVEQMVRRGGFKRGFRRDHRPVEAELLVEQIRRSVEDKIYSLIGMGRKAGVVTSGTNAVIDLLRKETRKPVVVLVADDISPPIGDKICRLSERYDVHHVRLFTKAKIGHLLGAEERSAVAFDKSPLADTLKFELSRFEQL